MTGIGLIIVFVLAIALMIYSISKLKFHPFLSIMAISLIFGLIAGIPLVNTTDADGNTVSDYGKEEQKRQISINTSVVPIEWNGVKINILDTPGYFDFVGEVEEAVSAADAAIIVVSGKAGIEVGTKKAWEMCEKY